MGSNIVFSSDDYGNTREAAQEINLGSKIKGNIDSSEDKDFFSFKPDQDGLYHIYDFKIIPKGSSESIEFLNDVLFIYDSEGKTVSYECNALEKFTVIDFKLDKNNKYYILVSSSKSISSFEYTFSLKGPTKDDVGDSIESAKVVEVGDRVEGSADFDIRISVDTEDFLSVESFYLNNKWLFILEKGKKYFLHTKYNNLNDEYSFSLKGPVEDDCGNTKEKAREIEFNKKVEINRNYYGDVDCLTFTPSVSGLYHINNLTDQDNTYSTLVYDLSIYDSSMNFIDKIRNEGNGYFNLDKDKKYFIYSNVLVPEPGKTERLVFRI